MLDKKLPFNDQIRSITIWILSILGIILSLELAFHLIAAPNLRLQKIVFDGNSQLKDADLMKLLGLREKEYYFSVDETALELRLSSVPWIRKALVQKTFPDTLKVAISQREPLALSLVSPPSTLQGARTAVLVVDSEGVVFDVRSGAGQWDLPIVSGVLFETIQPGIRFPETLKPLFSGLAELKKNSPGLFRMISEIEIRKNDRGSFDAVFYPVNTPVRVILGDNFNDFVLRQVFVLLDLVGRDGLAGKTREIDFRSTPVVFRPRES